MPTLMKSNSLVTKGFLAAGAYNIFGILIFSQFFTNTSLAAADPAVFSWLGQIAILLWGLAYCAVAYSYLHTPLLIAVFAAEKLLYSVAWLIWLVKNGSTIPDMAADSLLTAIFFSLYGVGDIISCLFFSWVVLQIARTRQQQANT
jgi:hypothetical protein